MGREKTVQKSGDTINSESQLQSVFHGPIMKSAKKHVPLISVFSEMYT